jgi:arginyl-tRNA synthetase
MALLDEAVAKARTVIDQARPDLDEKTRAAIAPRVGVGGVKYADLSVAHDSEYVFDLERMVALTGNTGPYLQYAAARIRSIFRTANLQVEQANNPIQAADPAERELGLVLLEFGTIVAEVAMISNLIDSAATCFNSHRRSRTSMTSAPSSRRSRRCARHVWRSAR